MDNIEKLKSEIAQSSNICVFTGAGISCPSGIPDFRSADGIYAGNGVDKYSPEQMVSHTFLERHTDMFYEFYRSKMLYPDAKPNKAHLYFAELEKQGKTVTVVTQNIDGLHQAAGSTQVAELHGSVHRNYCKKCGKRFTLEEILPLENVPKCSCGGIIRPDVVLYEESLDQNVINRALSYLKQAELLIVIGTSLRVYPAASFIGYFGGNTTALINKSETGLDASADIVINDDVEAVVQKLK